jgi:hypothetical protein
MERAIDEMPEVFRIVLVARLVEGMSVEETAALLGLRPETVKTRVGSSNACGAPNGRAPSPSSITSRPSHPSLRPTA